MKNILVPTDFSDASQNATKYAVSLAQAFDAAVYLVNAVFPPVLTDDSMLASVMITQAEIMAKSDELMEREIKSLSQIDSKEIKGYVKEGYALDIISKFADSLEVDLIVMGMKGKGKSISVFGSTTTTIIRKSTYPVFVIPEDATFSPIANITLASDLDSKINMDRYAILKSIAEKFNSKINIINVEKKPSEMSQKAVVGMMETSKDLSGHDYQFQSIVESDVETGINKFIEENPTEMLAMTARSHSFFDRLFGKVHTKNMSYQTKIPLLVLQDK